MLHFVAAPVSPAHTSQKHNTRLHLWDGSTTSPDYASSVSASLDRGATCVSWACLCGAVPGRVGGRKRCDACKRRTSRPPDAFGD